MKLKTILKNILIVILLIIVFIFTLWLASAIRLERQIENILIEIERLEAISATISINLVKETPPKQIVEMLTITQGKNIGFNLDK